MLDERLAKLAGNLLTYSVALQPGEKILLEFTGVELPLARALISRVYALGGFPYVALAQPTLQRELLLGLGEEQARDMARWDLARMRDMQAYIGVRAGENASELSDVPAEKTRLYDLCYTGPVHMEQRVPHTKWCVLRYPNYAMAQAAGMSLAAFEDFYFRVCNLDYAEMSAAMEPLKERMERADAVHILGPGTDLRFSVKGLPAVKCDGKMNIPDGEVFTAPVRDSVAGHITFNTPSLYQGKTFEHIRLEFAAGRVTRADAGDAEELDRILDTDAGARYIGEFSFGLNPFILQPMKDTLFDEKIAGSFHFTPGAAYAEADNGNQSAVHWDLVQIQRPDCGGGEIWFDGELIRKDGLFVPRELQRLNYREHL
ncbi:MAG: aminopeptidase [Gracilibacteraceae bacterium]|jgi:aminopeptidase|nr:aminopeptidase [Gracilibacteraceae bacterium]